MQKPLYKVDLSAQQAECEANYQRLLSLLPCTLPTKRTAAPMAQSARIGNQWRYGMRSDTGVDAGFIILEVMALAPYTTELMLAHHPDSQGPMYQEPWKTPSEFSLRLYHDVGMAEVAACNKHWYFRPRYHPNNASGFQIDERAQVNRFLGELLGHCLRWGHSVSHESDATFSYSDDTDSSAI